MASAELQDTHKRSYYEASYSTRTPKWRELSKLKGGFRGLKRKTYETFSARISSCSSDCGSVQGEFYLAGFGGYTIGHGLDDVEGTGILSGIDLGDLNLENSGVSPGLLSSGPAFIRRPKVLSIQRERPDQR
jgi:hypothetical protein